MDNLKEKGVQDRSRISLSEDWEVKYWAKALAVCSLDLQKAIKAVGNSAKRVREYLLRKSA